MMYQDKLVTAVKVAGKILREEKSGDATTVFVPFGSEYAVYLKNKNSVRVKVRVEIDGVDATKNTSLILGPQESIDFERFLDASNLEEGLRFKFIERTKKIEDGPRGIGGEDGLIRIEYEFERMPQPVAMPYNGWPYGHPYPLSYLASQRHFVGYCAVGNETPPMQATLTSTSDVRGATLSASSSTLQNSVAANAVSVTGSSGLGKPYDPTSLQEDFYFSQSKNDVGITVGGSVSDQKFQTGAWFPTDGVKHVMILSLRGQVGQKKVKEAVTVKTKLNCPTCGTTNKHGSKFCKECGTGLSIV